MSATEPGKALESNRPRLPVITELGRGMKEKADQERLREEKDRKFQPLIYWYLSFRCNLACAHCSVHSSPWVDTADDLTTEECMQVIDQLDELNVKAAILTGGEFLIRPDSMDILRGLADKGIGIGVESNGLRFPRGFAELVRDLQARDLFNISISLDGGTRETHERLRGPRSFDRTVRGLRHLKDNGIKFTVQCVLNGANYQTIPDLYRLAAELAPECNPVQWAMLNPIGRGVGLIREIGLQAEHIKAIFELIKDSEEIFPGETIVKFPPAVIPPQYFAKVFKQKKATIQTTCQFPLLGVLPNGDVSICALSRDDEELHFGNIRDPEVRLKNIWQKARMDMLRSSYVAAQDLQGICNDCVWKYGCKGACRAWAYEEGGSFDAPFPICEALDEAGAFPAVYRLSRLNAAAAQKYQAMGVGCGCSGPA